MIPVLRKVLREKGVFAEPRFFATDLSTVADGDIGIRKWPDQICNPVLISWHTVTTNENQDLSGRGIAANIQ